jgi:hypothetical protein
MARLLGFDLIRKMIVNAASCVLTACQMAAFEGADRHQLVSFIDRRLGYVQSK